MCEYRRRHVLTWLSITALPSFKNVKPLNSDVKMCKKILPMMYGTSR